MKLFEKLFHFENDKRVGAILPACIFLIFLMLLVLLLSPIIPPSLIVSSGNLVIFEHIVDSTECEVNFRHSVNKGIVREIFVISTKLNMLSLKTGYNESFGAGMIDTIETAEGLNFRKEDNWFILDFPVNWKQEIHYIGGNIAKHRFIYEGVVVNIGELRSQQPFTLSVQRRSIAEIFLKKRVLF